MTNKGKGKGKEVSGKVSAGKHKFVFDGDKTGNGRKRNLSGVLQFFDGAGDVEESNFSDFSDDDSVFDPGPEIWDDTMGNVDVLVAGTVTGTGQYLKMMNQNIKVNGKFTSDQSLIYSDGMLKHRGTYEIISPEDIGTCQAKVCVILKIAITADVGSTAYNQTLSC